MAMYWKLDEFLKARSITVYALSKEARGEVSITTLYSLANHPPKRVDLATFNAILSALERLTKERLEVGDLLEYRRD